MRCQGYFLKLLWGRGCTSNNKTNNCNRFVYQFTDKLILKNPDKNIALASLSIYYTWKNIKSEYNNNKFKISAPN